MAVRSTQGQHRVVRSTPGGRGVSPSYKHVKLPFIKFTFQAKPLSLLIVLVYSVSITHGKHISYRDMCLHVYLLLLSLVETYGVWSGLVSDPVRYCVCCDEGNSELWEL